MAISDEQRRFSTRVLQSYSGKTLKRGAKSKTARALQLFLRDQGYDLRADGAFGPKTEAAFKEWQQSQGLTADGKAGKKSFAKIKELAVPVPEQRPVRAEEMPLPPMRPEMAGGMPPVDALAVPPEMENPGAAMAFTPEGIPSPEMPSERGLAMQEAGMGMDTPAVRAQGGMGAFAAPPAEMGGGVMPSTTGDPLTQALMAKGPAGAGGAPSIDDLNAWLRDMQMQGR